MKWADFMSLREWFSVLLFIFGIPENLFVVNCTRNALFWIGKVFSNDNTLHCTYLYFLLRLFDSQWMILLERRLMKFAWNSIIVIDERLQNIYWNLEKNGFFVNLTSNFQFQYRLKDFSFVALCIRTGMSNPN
jgi:hypothetical protein